MPKNHSHKHKRPETAPETPVKPADVQPDIPTSRGPVCRHLKVFTDLPRGSVKPKPFDDVQVGDLPAAMTKAGARRLRTAASTGRAIIESELGYAADVASSQHLRHLARNNAVRGAFDRLAASAVEAWRSGATALHFLFPSPEGRLSAILIELDESDFN